MLPGFKHVFITWLLIQLVFPLVFISSTIILEGWFDSSFLLVLLTATPIFSFPALLVGWVAFLILMEFYMDVVSRFIIWMLIVFALIVATLWFTPVTLDNSIPFSILVPLLLSAAVILVFRYKQFADFKFNQSHNY